MSKVFRVASFLAMLLAMLILNRDVAWAAYDSPYMGNAILPGYLADPSIHYFNGAWYIYATMDKDASQAYPIAWRSTNFRDWTMIPMTFTNTTVSAFWAPGLIQQGSNFYMYYSKGTGGLFVAVSSSPEGPWTEIRQLASEATDIDPQPFRDNDANQTVYLYWGNEYWLGDGYVVRLQPNLTEFAHPPVKITPTNYTEGPYMIKRGSTYILTYSGGNYFDGTYNVRYATATSPYGPFVEGSNSPILVTSPDDTIDAPGHHSLFNYNGQDYILYHRYENPHDWWAPARQLAIDRIAINNNGAINDVIPTHDGISGFGWRYNSNLLRGKPVTVSSTESNFYRASYAVDDNNTTRWSSSGSGQEWLQVDLGSNTTIASTQIAFEFVGEWTQYKIEYSLNGTTWLTFADRTSTTNGLGILKDLAPGGTISARYLRVTITETQRSGEWPSIWDFKAFATVNPTS